MHLPVAQKPIQWPYTPPRDLILPSSSSSLPQPPHTSAPFPRGSSTQTLKFLPPLHGPTLLPHRSILSPSQQQSRSDKGMRRKNQVRDEMLAGLPGGSGAVISKPQEQPQQRCSEDQAAAETSYNAGHFPGAAIHFMSKAGWTPYHPGAPRRLGDAL